MTNEKRRQKVSFEEMYEENKRRIHYQIHKMNLSDPHQEFFQEGLCALWNAYETFNPDKGTMATYFNYTIRNRLIDKIRRDTRHQEKNQKFLEQKKMDYDDGNHKRQRETIQPLPDQTGIQITDEPFWKALQAHLTRNQWKWVDSYIIQDTPIKEIAEKENTSVEAVKSWGKQVRKKLRDEQFRNLIGLDIDGS